MRAEKVLDKAQDLRGTWSSQHAAIPGNAWAQDRRSPLIPHTGMWGWSNNGCALCHLRGHPPPTLAPLDSAAWKEKGYVQMRELVGSRGARTQGLCKPPSPPH